MMVTVSSPRPAKSLVHFENISKNYGSLQALESLSFEIMRGEVVGFLGPNGAGKTTAMRILSGFFAPSSGRVLIDGTDLFKNPQRTKKMIGYLPEVVSLYPDMRVREYLNFVARLKGVREKEVKTQVAEKLSLCGLEDVAHRLIGRLSKGYRQRAGLAQALIGDPSVLVLDEPTTGLDPKQITEIRELIRDLGKERAIVLSTHILSEVSMICGRVLMIDKGRILATGTVRELESCLKDRDAIFVTVGGARYKTEAQRLLAGIAGVENLRVSDEKEDEIHFALESVQGRDLRSEISELFVRKGIPLLEVHRAKLSLEDIFLRILRDGWFQGRRS